MRKVDMETYLTHPDHFELRNGNQPDAPDCSYGNKYQWIGYDLDKKEYVRFTKSVFKLLITKVNSM
jgi:hypothetical protein